MAEGDDEPAALPWLAEPVCEHGEVVAEAPQIFRGEATPIGLPTDLFQLGCGDARKRPGVTPIGAVRRHPSKRDVGRNTDQPCEYREREAAGPADRTGPVGGADGADVEPGHG